MRKPPQPDKQAGFGRQHHALDFVSICQTMSSIRSVLKALEKPDKPFIHDVNATALRRLQTMKLISNDTIYAVVEPDGFEPTTSCLQSTRSTN